MQILNKTPAEEKSPGEDRIVMLSDGVFAIAMTLLILDIRLPDGLGDKTFADVLGSLVPKIISYIISFMMIALYWSVHRRIIHYLKRIDGSFIQFNLVLLFFVTALPIPTTFAFQTQYRDPNNIATVVYTLALAMNGFALAALWLNATWKHRLVDPKLEQDLIDYFLVRSLISPVYFLLSLLILLLPVRASFVYYSWIGLYIVFLVLRLLQPRLFPRVTEHSEKHPEERAEVVLTEPIAAHGEPVSVNDSKQA